MADKKDSTPPPLLLMPASDSLTLSPAGGGSLLMPLPHAESSLLGPEEDGEADSFVGQLPGSQAAPFLFSASPAPSDPFSQIRQPPQSGSPGPLGDGHTPMSMAPPVSQPSPQMYSSAQATPPPRAMGSNMYRMAGPPRRAMPPPGMYSSTSASQFTPGGPPTMIPSQPPMSMPMSAPPQSLLPSMPNPSMFSATPGSTPYQPPPGPPSSTTPIVSSHITGAPQGDVMQPQVAYTPPQYHWFHCFKVEKKEFWRPFSLMDSASLEDAFLSGQQNRQLVSVEGGRYDVNILERRRMAVYWEEEDSKVMRCSWFYKPEGETRFAPYNEEFSEKLETEYRKVLALGAWHKAIEFPGEETIVIHSPQVIVHYRANAHPDEFGATQSDQFRPRVVKRGIEEFEGIPDGESPRVDHLVLVVHGIGSTCDLRFRNIIECVNDFRRIGQDMIKSHFNQYQQEGRIGRVEFLPVRWHAALHGDATGVDKKLKAITLNSIGKLRHYTNDTLLDILFYTSPAYCQTIADTVASEINRLYSIFCSRNHQFRGQVSLVGHSLGSLILFDLLSHQRMPGAPEPEPEAPSAGCDLENNSRSTTPSHDLNDSIDEGTAEKEEESMSSLEQMLQRLGLTEYLENFKKEHIDLETLMMCEDADIKEMGVPLGPRKKLQGYMKLYKKRQSRKKDDGERKAKQQQQQQQLQQQQQQIQHQQTVHDPVLRQASNTMVNFVVGGAGIGVPFVRYPQLKFAPTHFFALGSPIAMFFTVRGVDSLGEEFHLPTCPGFFNIFHPFDPVAYRIEPMITPMCPPKPFLMPHHKGRKRLHLELKESLVRMGVDLKQKIIDSMKTTWKYVNDFALAHRTSPEEMVQEEVNSVLSKVASQAEEDNLETGSIMSDMPEEDIMLGQLNQGRRVDFVLQEAPIESFNEYLFALGSHGCYWESEDTVLMILKEIYSLQGMFPRRPGQTPLTSPPSVPNLPPPGAARLSSPPGGFPQNSPMPPFSQPYAATGFTPAGYSPVQSSPYSGQSAPLSGAVGPPPRFGFVRK